MSPQNYTDSPSRSDTLLLFHSTCTTQQVANMKGLLLSRQPHFTSWPLPLFHWILPKTLGFINTSAAQGYLTRFPSKRGPVLLKQCLVSRVVSLAGRSGLLPQPPPFTLTGLSMTCANAHASSCLSWLSYRLAADAGSGSEGVVAHVGNYAWVWLDDWCDVRRR